MTPRHAIILLALAAAVAAVIAIWIWSAPSRNFPLDTSVPIAPAVEETPEATAPPAGGPAADSTGGAFDLGVLQRTGYKSLDLRPIQDGLLPIKPPATTGKANPFL